jgi:thiol-disulfide isomerase/thioredoxin
MAVSTPIADMGWPAAPFTLKGVDSRFHSLERLAGPKGTLVMFICNHCPYVKAIMPRILRDARELKLHGIHTIAINSNDDSTYPEDSFANMKLLAKSLDLPYHYLHDDTQEIARAYDAVCTPDFFGFDANLRLQYRGRLDASRKEAAPDDAPRELFDAMRLIAHYGYGPAEQHASMGCSIKWRDPEAYASSSTSVSASAGGSVQPSL